MVCRKGNSYVFFKTKTRRRCKKFSKMYFENLGIESDEIGNSRVIVDTAKAERK